MSIKLHTRTPWAHIRLHRHMLLHMHSTHTKTHTATVLANVNSAYFPSRFSVRWDCLSLVNTTYSAPLWFWVYVCEIESSREKRGSDEICCIRGCSGVWKRTGGSFFCHLALCAIFPIECVCVSACVWESETRYFVSGDLCIPFLHISIYSH